MSNDLISRSALLKKIQTDKEFLQKGLGKDSEFAYMSADSIMDKIKSMPVAYNMDKVVEKIEGLECKAIPRYNNGTFGDYGVMDYYVKREEVKMIIKSGEVE